MDTGISSIDSERYSVSSDERHWITRVRKLKEQYPNEVEIKVMPEDNDGCICAIVPAKWVRIQAPKQMNYTEEQLEEKRKRMIAIRGNKFVGKE